MARDDTASVGLTELDIPVLFEWADEALAGAATILARYPDVELRLYQDEELVMGERQQRQTIAARPDLWMPDGSRKRGWGLPMTAASVRYSRPPIRHRSFWAGASELSAAGE